MAAVTKQRAVLEAMRRERDDFEKRMSKLDSLHAAAYVAEDVLARARKAGWPTEWQADEPYMGDRPRVWHLGVSIHFHNLTAFQQVGPMLRQIVEEKGWPVEDIHTSEESLTRTYTFMGGRLKLFAFLTRDEEKRSCKLIQVGEKTVPVYELDCEETVEEINQALTR